MLKFGIFGSEEMSRIAADLERTYPDANDQRGVNVEPVTEVVFGPVRPALFVLLGAVALVLLVACGNLANLLLARGTGRLREITVRTALGAGVGRLARQFLIESAVLTLAGAALGLLLASAALQLLPRLAPASIPRVEAVALDGRVLAVTLSLSLVVAIVAGLVPTFQARNLRLASALQGDAARGGSASREHRRLRSGLVVAELALAVMLMVGAGLLIRSLWRLQQVETGFEVDGVLKAEFLLPGSRYPQRMSDFPAWPEIRRFHAEAVARLTRLRRRRPLVLTADRGRGKSAALGIACARLLAPGGPRLLVTAPRPAAVAALFERLEALCPGGRRRGHAFALGPGRVDFLPPDELTALARRGEVGGPGQWLLVDEAAAIPAPLLGEWLEAFPRIAFATTVHGYEGSGRGFALRFRRRLERRTPEWQGCHLSEPIRWAAGDPLEALITRLLLLDAEPGDAVDVPPTLRRVRRAELAADEPRLNALFGLLVFPVVSGITVYVMPWIFVFGAAGYQLLLAPAPPAPIWSVNAMRLRRRFPDRLTRAPPLQVSRLNTTHFSRVDRIAGVYVYCEAVALNNGALLAGTDMDPNVCQTCHHSFPTNNSVLVGSLNHCDVVR